MQNCPSVDIPAITQDDTCGLEVVARGAEVNLAQVNASVGTGVTDVLVQAVEHAIGLNHDSAGLVARNHIIAGQHTRGEHHSGQA